MVDVRFISVCLGFTIMRRLGYWNNEFMPPSLIPQHVLRVPVDTPDVMRRQKESIENALPQRPDSKQQPTSIWPHQPSDWRDCVP